MVRLGSTGTDFSSQKNKVFLFYFIRLFLCFVFKKLIKMLRLCEIIETYTFINKEEKCLNVAHRLKIMIYVGASIIIYTIIQ